MNSTDLLVLATCLTAVLILCVSMLLLKVVAVFAKESADPTPFSTEEEKRQRQKAFDEVAALKRMEPSIFTRLMGLKPMSEERNLIMEHEFDGITELNNPTPRWFMALFIGSMIFAVVYLFNYEVLGFGQTQEQEYVSELEQADLDKIAFLSNPVNAKAAVNESSVVLTKDAIVLKSGAALYANRCTPCHGEKAQGIVGPNLTDEFWLHGGTVHDVFKTIKYGVPEKGMISWEKSISAQQISDLTNYLLSLQGSHPAGAKAPQGEQQK
ncbi:MAG: Cytochrome [Pedobacter sp.]|jgi:cytochrome c oxidase cbb3-type subunit 3|nr:Cytochrome [Pedobacter sp.]